MPVFFYKGGRMTTSTQNSDLQGFGEEVRKELGRRLPREKRLTVLDVGTGFGINVAFLAGWLAKGSTVWTVDPSKEALDEVEASFDKESPSLVRFAVASADDLKFRGGFFDAVVSVMVLHHLEKLRPALREMSRVLKRGGSLMVVDFQPMASHELKFHTRHDESDFFKPEAVVEEMAALGLRSKAKDFGMWYLVEAKKTSARRPAERRRERPRSG